MSQVVRGHRASGDDLPRPRHGPGDPGRPRARPGRGVLTARLPVVPVALALAAVHGVLTWSRLASSWFWQDDLNILGYVADRPLHAQLLFDYNGHLQPGTWVLAWLSQTIAPLNWAFAGGVVLVLVVATDLALLAALVRMFGRRRGILLPFGLFCATTVTLPAT